MNTSEYIIDLSSSAECLDKIKTEKAWEMRKMKKRLKRSCR